MKHQEAQSYREQAIKQLPDRIGVYLLCDANRRVRYVGQTVDSIRKRVQRHTTSARSDIIANRLIDASEIAFVMAFPCEVKADVSLLETHLIHHYDAICPLMNGRIPKPVDRPVDVPAAVCVQIVSDEQLEEKRSPAFMLIKQLKLVSELSDYIIHVKDNPELRRSLYGAYSLLNDYVEQFCIS